MINHARASLPNEACGLLAGTGDAVTDVYCLENARHSPVSYELTGDGYRLVLELEDAGRLLAVFHSHPRSEAYPSPSDRRLAFWPIRYVLISLDDSRQPSVRVFRITKQDRLDPNEMGTVVEDKMETA